MILDLDAFLQKERPIFEELQVVLTRLEEDPNVKLSLNDLQRINYLYHRATSALAKLESLPATQEIRAHFEAVVGRAYAELHQARGSSQSFSFFKWLAGSVPETFRRQLGAFWLALAVTLLGAAFGAGAVAHDPSAKETLLPFSHLAGSPSERVRHEETQAESPLAGHHSTFAAELMVNNIRVSIMALALGLFLGLGTMVLLFYNGVILGVVCLDYVSAGQTRFLLGWLLPHGSVEIPAILLAGQGGLVLGGALLGWGKAIGLRERLRLIGPDLVNLIGVVALLLVWAGIVESFFSQYHEPVIPYEVKIAFGGTELVLLFLFLSRTGRSKTSASEAAPSLARVGTER